MHSPRCLTHNIVINVCEKFHDDRETTEPSLGERKSPQEQQQEQRS